MMNNTRTRSARQYLQSSPDWIGDNRLGYNGGGRQITKRYVDSTLDAHGAYLHPAPIVGFTTAYDAAATNSTNATSTLNRAVITGYRMSLAELFQKYPTDKNTVHSYADIYESLLAPLKESAEFVLEIGVCSGSSLRAWRDYFTKAQIVGIDQEQCFMIQDEPRISTWCGSQVDFQAITYYSRSRKIQYDLIIDDGRHSIESQLVGLFYLYSELKSGALYVIEDIQDAHCFEKFDIFPNVQKYDLRHVKGRYDDLMVVLRKP